MEQINKQILEKLEKMQIDIEMIKENLIDPDTILTTEEDERHEQALKELREGKAFSLEDVEKARKDAGLEI